MYRIAKILIQLQYNKEPYSMYSRYYVLFANFVTMTMTMTIFYSTIDIQIEIIMYNSLENQIIN